MKITKARITNLQAKSPKMNLGAFFAPKLGNVFQNISPVKKQVDHDDPAGYQENGVVAKVGGNRWTQERPENIANVHSALVPAEDPAGQLFRAVLGQHGLDLREEAGVSKTNQEAANAKLNRVADESRQEEEDDRPN